MNNYITSIGPIYIQVYKYPTCNQLCSQFLKISTQILKSKSGPILHKNDATYLKYNGQ